MILESTTIFAAIFLTFYSCDRHFALHYFFGEIYDLVFWYFFLKNIFVMIVNLAVANLILFIYPILIGYSFLSEFLVTAILYMPYIAAVVSDM